MTLRRIKNYTANTGYVYEYYFVGKRPAARPDDPPATEYVFEVSRDRKSRCPVTVSLSPTVLAEWAVAHGRSLTDAEQYAAVKMRLFEAFDQLEDFPIQGQTLAVDTTALTTALSTLGVD